MATAPDPADHNTRRQRQAKMLLAVALAAFGIWLSATFIPALIWAAIIGIAIDPLYARAEYRWPGGRKAVLPGIATLLIALLVLAPLALGVFQATREAHTLIAWWGEVRATGVAEPEWLKGLPMSAELSRWWQENLSTPEAAQQFHAIRGSSSKKSAPDKAKGGSQAFRDGLRFLKTGGVLAVTPDGPRGPVELMAEGAPLFGQSSGVPCFVLGLASDPCMSLNTWDRHRIPLPFSRTAAVWEKVEAPRGVAPAELAAAWGERLNAVTRRAEAIAAGADPGAPH